jgi:ribosome maturation factor RimP
MGTRSVNLQALEEVIRPAVEGQSYELVELHWGRELGGNILRVTIDRPVGQGRVSHSDCVTVSREVSALLDVKEVLPGQYSLEVSSPGIDRPLKRAADFSRFVGERVKVRMQPSVSKSNLGPPPVAIEGGSPAAPRRNFTGTIEEVVGDAVRLDVEGVGKVELYITEMEKANLIYSPDKLMGR